MKRVGRLVSAACCVAMTAVFVATSAALGDTAPDETVFDATVRPPDRVSMRDAKLLGAADDTDTRRTEQDYMLYCMGCHQRDGTGMEGRVPELTGLDRFLKLEGGREYLVRVPGVANTSLPDDRLARLLNWTLAAFASESWVPADFVPYDSEEVGPLRSRPFLNAAARARILGDGGTTP